MKEWQFVGVEKFRGKEYMKFERTIPSENPMAKKHLNLSKEQVEAILDVGVMELAAFAGVDPSV